MIAERIERQLDALEAATEHGSEALKELIPIILHNLRGELACLRSMEAQAFALWRDSQSHGYRLIEGRSEHVTH